MPIASRHTCCRWIANALKTLGLSSPKAVYDWIRKNEHVQAVDLSGETSDGENLFEQEVRFARWKMGQKGTVVSQRGFWAMK